jgi:hypothetical protein
MTSGQTPWRVWHFKQLTAVLQRPIPFFFATVRQNDPEPIRSLGLAVPRVGSSSWTAALVARPLSPARAAWRDARLIWIVSLNERFDRVAIHFARLHEPNWRQEPMVKDTGGDMEAARGVGSDHGGKPGQRDMHRRLGEVAPLEFEPGPPEMLQRAGRDREAMSDRKQGQETGLFASPLALKQSRPETRPLRGSCDEGKVRRAARPIGP